jgi:hypothetical protein
MQAPTNRDLVTIVAAGTAAIICWIGFIVALMALAHRTPGDTDTLDWGPAVLVCGGVFGTLSMVILIVHAINFLEYFRPRPYALLCAWLESPAFREPS